MPGSTTHPPTHPPVVTAGWRRPPATSTTCKPCCSTTRRPALCSSCAMGATWLLHSRSGASPGRTVWAGQRRCSRSLGLPLRLPPTTSAPSSGSRARNHHRWHATPRYCPCCPCCPCCCRCPPCLLPLLSLLLRRHSCCPCCCALCCRWVKDNTAALPYLDDPRVMTVKFEGGERGRVVAALRRARRKKKQAPAQRAAQPSPRPLQGPPLVRAPIDCGILLLLQQQRHQCMLLICASTDVPHPLLQIFSTPSKSCRCCAVWRRLRACPRPPSACCCRCRQAGGACYGGAS